MRSEVGSLPRGRRLLWEMEAVTGQGIGEQKPRVRRVGLDLLAQAVHKDSQVFELVSVIRPPNRLQELAMRNGLVGARQQVGEQIELPGRQPGGAAVHGRLA